MLKFITHRPLWLNILVGILLAVGVFALFVLSLKWLTHHNVSKTVPYVIGKSFDEAESILKKAGFEVEIQDSIYTDTARAHQVLKQFPEGDEVVKINRTVYVTINRSQPPLVPMPNLIGFSFRNAEMTLKNHGLRFGDSTSRPDFAKNAVLEQMHNGRPIVAGTMIRMGTEIDFVLGSGVGNEEFSVPNLVGETYGRARALLEGNGLVVGVVVPSGEIEDTMRAFIYRQSPERFNDDKKIQKIRSGQTIDLWIQADKPVSDSAGAPAPTQEN
jgi:eukaryotic-like serine/threonine-protein kinase